MKFTKYGEVSLDISTHSRDPLVLRFDINDTGIGISESDQQRLFKPFCQGDPSITRQFGGTGLGLAICKHLVDLFNGTITVQSRLGRGSTFSFTATFQLDPSRPDNSLASALDITKDLGFLRGLRVLVIDDNATNCISLETTLASFGCTAMCARSGMDGIDVLRSGALKGEPIDMVILDYHMPHMSGLDVARAIARLGLTPKIIALASSVDAKLASEPNIMAICAKPVRRGQLLHMMSSILAPAPLKEPVHDDTNAMVNAPPIIPPNVCVLIVEDNDTNRKVVSCLLQQAHCRVVEAVNGIEALDKISDEVNLVLMDVHMPVLDGITATRLLLKSRPNLPIIYLSADVTEDTKKRCDESGAVCTLLKPVNRSLLLKTLATVLRQRFPHPAAMSDIPTATFRCLIVDDISTNRQLAAHLLKRVFGQDTDVNLADSGQAAIKFLSTQTVDLVLMDIKMPSMSGIEATRLIRALPLQRSVQMRIIGVSGLDDDATLRECTDAGMDSVLVKPLHESHIRSLRFMFSRSLAAPTTAMHLPPVAIPPHYTEQAMPAALFDETHLLDLAPAMRTQIIAEWKTGSKEQLSVLKSAPVSGQEWKHVEEVAHALKGSSAQLGALRLSQIALAIERLAKGEAPSLLQLRPMAEEMERVYQQTLAHMDRASPLKRTELHSSNSQIAKKKRGAGEFTSTDTS